jgi:hypothetical protein
MIYMSNGAPYECIYNRDKFDSLIATADSLVDLTTIREN